MRSDICKNGVYRVLYVYGGIIAFCIDMYAADLAKQADEK